MIKFDSEHPFLFTSITWLVEPLFITVSEAEDYGLLINIWYVYNTWIELDKLLPGNERAQ